MILHVMLQLAIVKRAVNKLFMAHSFCYTFADIVICLSKKGDENFRPFDRHIEQFKTQAAPTFCFDVVHHKPILTDEAGVDPVFIGKYCRLYQQGQARCFQISLSKNQCVGWETFLYLDSNTQQGKMFYQNEGNVQDISPLHYRVLELLLADIFAFRKGIFLHAMGIVYQQQTYVFTGFSEAGKSTLAQLWMKVPGVEVISDERVIICERQGKIWAYGTPWKSTAGQGSPSGAPLKKIYFIHHGAANEANRLKSVQASAGLFTHAYPAVWDKDRLSANLDLINQVVTSVPCYSFGFVPDPTAIEYLLCHA